MMPSLTGSTNPGLDDVKFYMRSVFVLIALAIVAGTLLTWVKMEPSQVASVVVSIMGFAALIVAQTRSATRVMSKPDGAEPGMGDKAAALREALAMQREQIGRLAEGGSRLVPQVDEVETTGAAVHALVSHEQGLALQALALASERLAAMTGTEEDHLTAMRAARTLREHEARRPVPERGVSDS
jgi:hypothetical protein